MLKQSMKYIDKDICQVFHFLELKHSVNFLIGSQKIRNVLYANDYDLNSNLKISDTISVLKKIHQEFIHIFDIAHSNPDYYIIDFKNGVLYNEPIRWSYHDIVEGFVKIDGQTFTFEQCLMMDDNVIKLDLCYLYNEIFTDINCLYNLHIVNDKKDLKKSKDTNTKSIVKQLKQEIDELQKEGSYYKALKREFSLGMVQGKFSKEILHIMNSEYGMYYKFISFLKLVVEMLDQDFKPVSISLIKSNLEYIKQFGSHIVDIDIDPELNRLVKIIGLASESKIKTGLEKLVDDSSCKLDQLIHKLI